MPDNETKNEETNKREAPISYRPPAALREEFDTLVKCSGLSVNAFLTQAVFGPAPPRRSRRDRQMRALLARLLTETAHIHRALHDIALAGGDTPANAQLIEGAMDDLAAIRAALIRLDGRRP